MDETYIESITTIGAANRNEVSSRLDQVASEAGSILFLSIEDDENEGVS